MHLIPGRWRQTNRARRSQRSLSLIIILLATITLACGFLRPAPRSISGRALILTRLPTLTRTPLPTLTPTAISQNAPALAHTINEAGPPSALIPTSTIIAPAPAIAAAPTIAPLARAVGPAPAEVSPTVAGPTPTSGAQPPQTAQPLPTQPAATATEISPPTNTPTATATETPLPTGTPTPTIAPTPTETPTPEMWLFSGVRSYPNPYGDGLLLYGNLINNTGATQALKSVLGTFYDTQNQMIAGPDGSDAYWPGYTVSPGGSMPFELTVETIDNAANFDLVVEAEPSEEAPRQDFEFLDLEQQVEEDSYCVNGEVRNQGAELQEYLIIALELYDSQENLISFSYYEELAPDWVEDDDTLEFELCADLLQQPVAHHTVQAWGR